MVLTPPSPFNDSFLAFRNAEANSCLCFGGTIHSDSRHRRGGFEIKPSRLTDPSSAWLVLVEHADIKGLDNAEVMPAECLHFVTLSDAGRS